jgi:hypothetical protein
MTESEGGWEIKREELPQDRQYNAAASRNR